MSSQGHWRRWCLSFLHRKDGVALIDNHHASIQSLLHLYLGLDIAEAVEAGQELEAVAIQTHGVVPGHPSWDGRRYLKHSTPSRHNLGSG